MPSVGMRRTTRVFGVVKGADGARVLRSGRRIWPESGENKLNRRGNNNDGDDWLHNMIKCSSNKDNGWTTQTNSTKLQTKTNVSKLKKVRDTHSCVGVSIGCSKVTKKKKDDSRNKMFGLVYSRKRRRIDTVGGVKQDNLDSISRDNKMFGIHFSRRQRRRLAVKDDSDCFEPAALSVVIDHDGASCTRDTGLGLLSSFLHLVLGCMRKSNLSVPQLAAFLLTDSVCCAFASCGIRFLQDTPANRTGVCKIFRVESTVPVFSLDFPAAPFCFMYMHLRLAFIFKCLSLDPVNNSLEEDSYDEMMSESVSSSLVETDTLLQTDISGNKVSLHPSVRASKLSGRHGQYRNLLNSRGIQKRRTSFRRNRARNLSVVGNRANGALVSDLISSRKKGIPFSSVVSKDKLRRSARINPAENLKEASPARPMDSFSCSTNLLVIESDRCYRMVGATVTLEVSDLNEWVLAFKMNGLIKYSHLAQTSMRPCSFNRITHDVIWSGDENWKLEFPDRQHWLIFKDLYKKCSDRNVLTLASKAIPIPGVCEVSGYEYSCSLPFFRTDAYICSNSDEVARALAKSTANYDMDCEDEEWLKKFNSDFFVESEPQEHLSDERFELMIDAFERALYSSPDDFADEKAAVNICIDLGRREVVEAVYGYWMIKRKLRRGPLLRVFQLYQAKKAPLIPKPGLRKRRSFKRQASQIGRGKQPSMLQVMAAQHDAFEEQNALRKVEAAKASAKDSTEVAIVKRRQAQMLMENADLAVYRATMATRIAEAACLPTETDISETLLLD
ncbi:uncharacterized protein LOC126660580 [Mercurialis annua]|uniref:uncharacterized protein LOC126660580 n=1 Tax=Mercurialis annua TaxID=3986 RepID=UPI002160E684|nr:uncharacterized protein LOC126660580 [Mercurialis annua]